MQLRIPTQQVTEDDSTEYQPPAAPSPVVKIVLPILRNNEKSPSTDRLLPEETAVTVTEAATDTDSDADDVMSIFASSEG